VPSPPDGKKEGELSKKLNFADNATTPGGANVEFDKFVLEPFNMNETSFWQFMQTYLTSKIESRVANSFYDYE
jgi:hypothetical protein